MIQRNYEMEVLINGKPAREHYHNGKVYIEGRKESVFTIRLRNNTPERVLFVPSVDGLSVMDGEDASFDDRGYIVDGYSSMLVDGWRLSDNKVAEFYFSSPEKSYRKRTNKGNNLGSIAVAVFKEIKPYITINYDAFPKEKNIPFFTTTTINTGNSTTDTYTATSGASSASLSASNSVASFSSQAQDVGTGFGDTIDSHVMSVYFNRQPNPDQILELFYNSREQLENMGIDFRSYSKVVSAPNAFPAQPGYCVPPRN